MYKHVRCGYIKFIFKNPTYKNLTISNLLAFPDLLEMSYTVYNFNKNNTHNAKDSNSLMTKKK